MGFGDNMYNVVYQQCEKIFEAIYIGKTVVRCICVSRIFYNMHALY